MLYYHSVFTVDVGSTEPPKFTEKTQEILSNVHFMEETVEELLLSRDPKKAAGPDEIESRFLKECAEELAPVLTTERVVPEIF